MARINQGPSIAATHFGRDLIARQRATWAVALALLVLSFPVLSCVGSAVGTPTSAEAGEPAWRSDLKKGDILFEHKVGDWGILASTGYWTHLGIYDGGGRVIEAISGVGVTSSPVAGWDYPGKNDVGIYRLTGATQSQIDVAVAFAQKQAGNHRPYQDWLLYWDFSASSETAWYCSELVWAAYLKAGIDLVPAPNSLGIAPSEIAESPLGGIVGGHGAMPD